MYSSSLRVSDILVPRLGLHLVYVFHWRYTSGGFLMYPVPAIKGCNLSHCIDIKCARHLSTLLPPQRTIVMLTVFPRRCFDYVTVYVYRIIWMEYRRLLRYSILFILPETKVYQPGPPSGGDIRA